MQSVARFRVVSPFMAVSEQREGFVPVPEGAVIETSADLQDTGLVTIILDGTTLLAFHRDIIERAKPVDDHRREHGC